jgi:prophage regulatory protein
MTKPVQQTLLDDGDARMCVDRCRVYRVKELASLINLHPITIWRWQATGRLPKPIKLGPHTTVWRASDIAAWLDQKAQEPQQRLPRQMRATPHRYREHSAAAGSRIRPERVPW